MAGYAKLFGSILTSSIWGKPHATRIVWISMLAAADADGVVDGSVSGFARVAAVTVEEMRDALVTLTSPDDESRTPDHDGRRVEAIDGGWLILNYAKYRQQAQAKEGSRAPYHRAWRAKQRAGHFRDDHDHNEGGGKRAEHFRDDGEPEGGEE